ncbi:MAG TPA: GntR family transcriptional regulator [Steroidobacteraceae bacterium]|nr:GntR family transcriptional regulator [Steroidobacteraceae bacterium]
MARAFEKAYRLVRDGIVAGRFPPSRRITEQEVATAAGVSRTPVREALRRLHAEGIVDFRPNQGAIVTAWSAAETEEIFELRALLESHGARRAARFASDAQIAALRDLAERQRQESLRRSDGHIERIWELNSRFHQLLQQAARSPRLSKALAFILEAPLVVKTFENYSAEELERSAAHHLEIVRALEHRDGDWAASVMRTHILAASRTLRDR